MLACLPLSDHKHAIGSLSGVLCRVVLAVFAGLGIFFNQTSTPGYLFGAATLLPAIIYLSTVIFYIIARRRLPLQVRGLNLGAFEWPVIILALVWLLWELAIFRDAQPSSPSLGSIP